MLCKLDDLPQCFRYVELMGSIVVELLADGEHQGCAEITHFHAVRSNAEEGVDHAGTIAEECQAFIGLESYRKGDLLCIVAQDGPINSLPLIQQQFKQVIGGGENHQRRNGVFQNFEK